jgi:hypothetical protein
MHFYKNVSNKLWELLYKFEMNIMNIKYVETLFKECN